MVVLLFYAQALSLHYSRSYAVLCIKISHVFFDRNTNIWL